MQILQKTQKIVRYQAPNSKRYYGVVEGDVVLQSSSDFTEIVNNEIKFDGIKHKHSDIKILEPVSPSKIINFGWTYAEHARETGGTANLKEPFLFLKPISSLIPNEGEIILPSSNLTKQVEMEGEVALVIGKRGKNIKEEEAMDYVFGYTIFNDVTARDLTKTDPQFTRGKGFDTFGPLGPWITTGIDPTNLKIVTTLNDKVVQEGNTNEMSLSLPFLISWISQVMTLEPGDVLATGSPAGSCQMKSGDIVVVEVEKIGKLRNYVK
ncbi:2-keto-4-pentenoate hydratase/2-oxohepta-3-ene-1,7-dioic acid hydratase in catechol pathway [Planomicrobium stackebrandtii]|uniref:2-keto-4-pentenoate hydratase/2-oxohepta-3-ene-1,7-dioic acid hydratase in catechol pathway n=1 Tax=Planomicrobium stackebrandtii TaxID=253160 RepID=A0ABU0GPA1_9BACL|nr:fumarylacetoacetate hydrolase family protein [Planomicrobium stackebrandtii]MDQ0427186.1 2-keto-4-pentenoate hydratase/2-oxohepta-3-ene-1,7-dioic acid hydratase in catechol pathway [Planomicrobium stackebrandtii]